MARHCLLWVSLVCVFAMMGCTSMSKKELVTMELQAKSFEREITKTVGLQYYIYLPEGYNEGDNDWPLMLFMHGAGERGEDLTKVKAHPPVKMIEQGKQFPFVLIAPQCPTDDWWPRMTDELSAILDEIEENYRIDEDRIYVTGLSMGGYGTWALAITEPDRFAAIVPICGAGDSDKVETIKHIPTWVFHGGKDDVVPIDESKSMVDALEACGGNVKFTVYPEAGHDSWTQTYTNPALYEWFLSHKRPAQK